MTKPHSFEAFKIPYYMLMLTGTWPMKNPKTWYKIKGIICYLLITLLGIAMFLEAYHNSNDFAKLSETLFFLVAIISYLIKHPALFLQGKTFIRMIELLQDPILYSYPDELNFLMVNRINSSQLLANCFRYLILVCLILMSITPFFDNRPLPFPFPYDLGVYRPIMYIFQIITVGLLGWINPSFDSLIGSLIGLGATHFEILSKKIVRILNGSEGVEKKSNKFIRDQLKECIDHHMAVIEYVECIEHVFSAIVFCQCVGSVIMICNTLFRFVLISSNYSQFFMITSYLCNALLQIFIYCWFGEDLLMKSQYVREACYISDWYNYGNDVHQYLFIIMERSKRPLRITAFKYSALSLRAFTSIIQWSYSYYTLLMKLYKKRIVV